MAIDMATPVAAEVANVSVGATPTTAPQSAKYSVSESDLKELGIDLNGPDKAIDPGKMSADPKLEASQETEDLLDDEDDDENWELPSAEEDETELAAEEAKSEVAQELELERFGVKHKVTLDKARELAQQGFDYNVRMAELKEERQSFEKERASFTEKLTKREAELQETIQEKEQMDYFFDYLKSDNPELFSQVESIAKNFNRQVRNPFMEKMMAEQKKQFEQLRSFTEQHTTQITREKFDREMAELRDMHNKKFGQYFKLDEQALSKLWADDPKNAKTLKQAYGILYGDKLVSLAQSKSIIEKKKTRPRVPSLSRASASAPSANAKNAAKKMSYSRMADEILAGRLR